MAEGVPWRSHLVRGGLVLVAVLAYQQIARGAFSPIIALVVACGYVGMAELVGRYAA